MRSISAVAVGIALVLVLAPSVIARDRPHYDIPPGYAGCPKVTAWNGFFKWVSVKHTSCVRAAGFLRAYARKAALGPMPRRLRGFRCTIRYWRNADGDIYASRHRCVRDRVVIRFYGRV